MKITRSERDLLEAFSSILVVFYGSVDSIIQDLGKAATSPYRPPPEDEECTVKLADLKRWVGQSSIACRKKLQICDAIDFAVAGRQKAERVIHALAGASVITPHIAHIADVASDLILAAGWLHNVMQWYDGRILQRNLPARIRTAVSQLNDSSPSE